MKYLLILFLITASNPVDSKLDNLEVELIHRQVMCLEQNQSEYCDG